jgi:hypothetical protein
MYEEHHFSYRSRRFAKLIQVVNISGTSFLLSVTWHFMGETGLLICKMMSRMSPKL